MPNVYSFLNVQCALTGPGGAINLGMSSGAAEEGITFAPTGEMNTMTIGADGSGQHSLHADRSGKVTIRILKTSPTNKQLSAMFAAQRSSGAAHGQNTISLVDTLRGDNITCTQVAFSKQPDLGYAKEAGLVEWEFEAINMDMALGQ